MGTVSRNAETEGLGWPHSACAGHSHLHDKDTDEGEEEFEQLGKFSLLKCPKGSVAVLYVCFVSLSIEL